MTSYGQAGGNRTPVARRTFRHPAGAELVLVVDTIAGGSGDRWYRVILEGAPPAELATARNIAWHKTRAAARQDFADRQRALVAAGYVNDDHSEQLAEGVPS